MTFPFPSYTPAPQRSHQQLRGVGTIGADEALSCSSSDGASSSTRSSVCASTDWENCRGRRSEAWNKKAGMEEAWKTGGSLSGPLQQERKLQQQFLCRHAQQQQQQASLYGTAQQQQLYGRQEGQPFFAKHLQGTAAAAATPSLQQHCMQQPLPQQLLVHPGDVVQQQAPPLLLPQQQQHLQQANLQQRCVQQPYTPQQDCHYVLPALQQPTLQQQMLRTYLEQKQYLQGCDWPFAKRERPQGDPLVRLTITVMKYRCRHAAPRKGSKTEYESGEDLPANGTKSESFADSVASTSSSSCSGGSSSSDSRSSRRGSGSNTAGSSRRGEGGGGGSVSSSILFFAGKRADKGSQKKSEEAGGCMALQPFTVTYSAAVHASLLESLPLFGRIHSELFGTPERVVLLAFEQEDHVSAETLWRLLDFCRLLQTHPAAAAFCADATTAAGDGSNLADLSREAADAAATFCASAVSGLAAAAVHFVARMPVEQLLLTYAGCLLLLKKLQGLQQQQDALEEKKEQQQLTPTTLPEPFLHAQQQQPLLHPQQQHHSSYTRPTQHFSCPQQQQQQEHQFHGQAWQGQEQQYLFPPPAHQQQENGICQGYGRETGSVETCAAAPRAAGASGCEQAAAATADKQQVTPLLVLQHVRDAGAAKLERVLDEALLPVCCCIAHRYDDLRLLGSCYWLLRHLLLEKGLPPEWKEPSAQPHLQTGPPGTASAAAAVAAEASSGQQQQRQPEDASDAVAQQRDQGRCTAQQLPQQQPQQPHQSLESFTQQQQLGQKQQQLYCQSPFFQPHALAQQQRAQGLLHIAGGEEGDGEGGTERKQQTEDDSWMPASLFAQCTGRKACFSVHEATLQHLSYVVPLTVFWRVVAEEMRRKSAFLAEPRGYLHCEIRRLRTPSGSSFVYPHAYFLFADAASCRQLGLQQQVAVQHQPQQQQAQHRALQHQTQGVEEQRKVGTQQHQEGPVMLLFGRRQSEYSAVDFFLPSHALLEAASRCGFASEQEGVEERTAGAHQQLLAAAEAAETYGKDYLGTLHAGFWGTRFSLRHWGMKQPCKLEGGEALPSPLALTSEADAPYSFSAAAAAAASTAAATAAAAAVRAAASSSKKIIYTRVIRVYQQPVNFQDTTFPATAAPAAAHGQLPQPYVLQQQQYARQLQQQYTRQQQYSLLEQYAFQQQADDYVLHQRLPQPPEQRYELQQQQQQQHVRSVGGDVGYGETSDATSGTPASSDVDQREQQQQQQLSAKSGMSPAKNGIPFFFSCGRSRDETLPAAGEVAEVQTAEQSHTSGRRSSCKGEQHSETPEGSRGSSSQEELRPIHVVPHQQETELCTVEFETNLRGDLPRQMSVKLLRDSGSYNLESVKPRWDESIRAYSLPFFGRAKVPSAKNVQLTPTRAVSSSGSGKKRSNTNSKTKRSSSSRREAGQGLSGAAASAPAATEEEEAEDEEANTSIYLMMGKLSKDVFALDFRAPVRIFEAFAIAAATLAKKRAVS